MRQSLLFTKTERFAPKDEEAMNAKLLTRAGFIKKIAAGVYAYLPLGLRVLKKISNIVREEMNAIGGEELLMTALVSKSYWDASGRWERNDVMFKMKSERGEDMGLGWTHEEPIAQTALPFIQSYKDLPKAIYQIQTKFRNEPRVKSGILRGREFLMKDLYSFHASKDDLDVYYATVMKAYANLFKRLSLDAKITETGGGAFTTEYTHEFQVLSPVGEDVIFYCEKCDFSQNKEIVKVKGGDKCPKCGGKVKEDMGIEVGNVFKLGTRFSEAFGLDYLTQEGKKEFVVMGSYGIGISRLMGTLVEVFHDDKGMMWPEAVAPFKVHLLTVGESDTVKKYAEKTYKELENAGVEVLFDDRDAPAGEKFADADLIGIPYRAVVSEKTGEKVELKKRSEREVKLISMKELHNLFSV